MEQTSKKKTSKPYSPEFRERAVRLAIHRGLAEFFMPLIALRNRKKGYAVSMIKAGADLVGHPAGGVRAPLTDLEPAEREVLADLVARAGRLVPLLS